MVPEPSWLKSMAKQNTVAGHMLQMTRPSSPQENPALSLSKRLNTDTTSAAGIAPVK